jgi:hypothetical protein
VEGHPSVVVALLDLGADRNATMPGSFTALALAAEKGHSGILSLLSKTRLGA